LRSIFRGLDGGYGVGEVVGRRLLNLIRLLTRRNLLSRMPTVPKQSSPNYQQKQNSHGRDQLPGGQKGSSPPFVAGLNGDTRRPSRYSGSQRLKKFAIRFNILGARGGIQRRAA